MVKKENNRLKIKNSRKETWMRIIVLIVSGIVLGLWKVVVSFITVLHWLVVLFTNKRSQVIASFANQWIAAWYQFVLYLAFVTNKRPFPFGHLKKPMDKFEK